MAQKFTLFITCVIMVLCGPVRGQLRGGDPGGISPPPDKCSFIISTNIDSATIRIADKDINTKTGNKNTPVRIEYPCASLTNQTVVAIVTHDFKQCASAKYNRKYEQNPMVLECPGVQSLTQASSDLSAKDFQDTTGVGNVDSAGNDTASNTRESTFGEGFPHTKKIRLKKIPKGAVIYIDGERMGTTTDTSVYEYVLKDTTSRDIKLKIVVKKSKSSRPYKKEETIFCQNEISEYIWFEGGMFWLMRKIEQFTRTKIGLFLFILIILFIPASIGFIIVYFLKIRKKDKKGLQPNAGDEPKKQELAYEAIESPLSERKTSAVPSSLSTEVIPQFEISPQTPTATSSSYSESGESMLLPLPGNEENVVASRPKAEEVAAIPQEEVPPPRPQDENSEDWSYLSSLVDMGFRKISDNKIDGAFYRMWGYDREKNEAWFEFFDGPTNESSAQALCDSNAHLRKVCEVEGNTDTAKKVKTKKPGKVRLSSSGRDLDVIRKAVVKVE